MDLFLLQNVYFDKLNVLFLTGQIFFTPEDLANLANYKLDKTSEKMIQILRHTQRLRQTHVNKKVVLYILLVS